VIHAAGLLILDPQGNALFVKRGPAGDHAGEWALPGGGVEGDETAEQCALREAAEELGVVPKGTIAYLSRHRDAPLPPLQQPVPAAVPTLGDAVRSPEAVVAPLAAAPPPPPEPVDFTTFVAKVEEQFTPKLNEESVGYAWAPVTEPPQPLHPGVHVALSRLAMTTETEVAQAIASGELTSPQQFANSWLFAMRITGTGAAYRRSWDEYVWRSPDLYMTPEFLARCNGLPVIMEHPKGATLNTKEYAARNVGTILLPYLRPEANEVWGIARIIDEPAAKLMESEQLSTSPAVVFHDPSVNTKLEDGDGKTILIEGKPSLLDHLAVCDLGVWDRGGDPRGIESVSVNDAVAFSDSDVVHTQNRRRYSQKLNQALASVNRAQLRAAHLSLQFTLKGLR
jgi:8-oxo-dGTP pyrophosphatase MutT (NUDIX family)